MGRNGGTKEVTEGSARVESAPAEEPRRRGGRRTVIHRIVGGAWVLEPWVEEDRCELAREVIGVALGHIQPSVRAPVLPHTRDVELAPTPYAQTGAPVTFIEGPERLVIDGFQPGRGDMRRRPLEGIAGFSPSARRKAGRRQALAASMREMDSALETARRTRKDRAVNRRPGTGGRQSQDPAEFNRDADAHPIAEVIRHLGRDAADYEAIVDGVPIAVFVLDPDGDVDLMLRQSTNEETQGDRMTNQLVAGLRFAERESLRIREVIVVHRCSGGRDPDFRPDLVRLKRNVTLGLTRGVIWRSFDRIARHQEYLLRITRELSTLMVDMYVVDAGGKIDLQKDKLQIGAMSLVSDIERDQIVRRTHSGLNRRWVEQGRGWPGAKRFGFRRNEQTKRLEVDPEQWPHVQFMHTRFAELKLRKGGGVRGLAAEMAERGCPISEAQIRRCLRDPIYCTGEWYIYRQGKPYPGEPVLLEHPIPIDIFERNQQLLGVVAKHASTPPGQFVLNGLLRLEARGENVRLACYNGKRPRRYVVASDRNTHVPPALRGWGGVEPEEIEPIVMRELRRLARAEVFSHALAEARRHDLAPVPTLIDAGQEEEIRREIDAVQRRLQQAEDEFIAGGDVAGASALIDRLERRRARLERRLSAADGARALAEQRRRAAAQAPDEDLVALFDELFCDVCPDDPITMLRRSTAVRCVLSKVVLTEREEGLFVRLYGPLIPQELAPLQLGPAQHAREVIEEWAIEKARGRKQGEAMARRAREARRPRTSGVQQLPDVPAFPLDPSVELDECGREVVNRAAETLALLDSHTASLGPACDAVCERASGAEVPALRELIKAASPLFSPSRTASEEWVYAWVSDELRCTAVPAANGVVWTYELIRDTVARHVAADPGLGEFGWKAASRIAEMPGTPSTPTIHKHVKRLPHGWKTFYEEVSKRAHELRTAAGDAPAAATDGAAPDSVNGEA